ncbi:hypothetical protein OPV22_023180 [Ensete ventricosum]|uniref:Uncharacterized protein n=1 Tax=Ensete ventricosum TaxID=4639 RepID=A0AAV8QRH1_ENSVE|nr:hypothetical protein OPV22_023180 [Ensete ventricosum]
MLPNSPSSSGEYLNKSKGKSNIVGLLNSEGRCFRASTFDCLHFGRVRASVLPRCGRCNNSKEKENEGNRACADASEKRSKREM